MRITSLLTLATATWMPSASVAPVDIDFTDAKAQTWRVLNDNVMGGISTGDLSWGKQGLRWVGETRLENNGGFSSVRAPWGTHDFSDVERVIITCRGTGGPFKLTLETSRAWYMPYAFASFDPTEDWSEVVLPLSAFRWSQAFTGDTRFSTSLSEVLRIGLLKYDGSAQSFDLEVSEVRFQ